MNLPSAMLCISKNFLLLKFAAFAETFAFYTEKHVNQCLVQAFHHFISLFSPRFTNFLLLRFCLFCSIFVFSAFLRSKPKTTVVLYLANSIVN